MDGATHFSVSGFPTTVTAGSPAAVTITVLDASNNVVSGYTGTVHFTSTDTQAVLPADYTFTTANDGTETLSVTLPQLPARGTITATDTANPAVIGKEQGITVAPAAASYFVIAAPPSVNAGGPFSVTVSAKDPYKNVATGYTGTVHFTSSDAQAGLPADYTFSAADAGVHVFSVTLESNGSQSIAATDTGNTSITGQLERSRWTGRRTSAFPGSPQPSRRAALRRVTVTVLDASNNVVSGYTGTVHFTSTDTQAVLPADYTFTTANDGTMSFSVSLPHAGTHDYRHRYRQCRRDRQRAGHHRHPRRGQLFRDRAPPSVSAGVPFSVTVSAKDPYKNVATGYTGTVHFTSSDAQAGLPADYTFTAADAGMHVFSVTLESNGSQSIAATDTSTASITGQLV